MKPILIIKTGTTVSSIKPKRGDFEDWIIAGMALPADRFQVASVYQGDALPDIDDIAAIVVTGSAAMVTDSADWSEAAAAYLKRAVELELPVLGICYGHQLLAHALGGVVDFHPQGREIGTVEVRLTGAAKEDPLLAGLPSVFPAHSSHSQAVISLPSAATVLAHNAFEPHHGVRFAKYAWGLQFHPEFDVEIMCAYLSERQEDLRAEGLNVDALLAEVREAPEAASALLGFTSIVNQSA